LTLKVFRCLNFYTFMCPDSSDKILNIYIGTYESQKVLFFAEQRANGGKTKLYAQSYVCLEDFSGLTDGNKVDRCATAWSRAACACVACNPHIFLAYKQRNTGIICQTISQ
jgi:hypothetical protein